MATALRLVTDFSRAIDCGAHRGGWTGLLAEHFASVIAFEPAPDLMARLRNRFAGAPNVTLVEAAVLDLDGLGEMITPAGHEGKRRGRYAQSAEGGRIEVKRIDSFAFDACGLIKLDIEGGELSALKGARNLLARCSPVIVVEEKAAHARRFGWRLDDLHNWLRDRGYIIMHEFFPDRLYAKVPA